MKNPLPFTTAVVAISLIARATADTIYSNLQDTVIPTDFTGVFIDVDGNSNWDINPFFGGVGVANSAAFQPVRTSAGNLGTLQNFAVGSSIDVSGIFATGYGGSQDHLGSTYTAGLEGYLGFRLAGNYGWMRVIFTGNTAGAVVKDWAYDNGGAAIIAGRVQQSAVSAGTQLVTLSPGSGESFTLGSLITDTAGNINSLLKTGAGTTTLAGTSTYSGVTGISNGKLIVNGNIASSSATTVSSGGTLAGAGTVGVLTVDAGGFLSPGDGGQIRVRQSLLPVRQLLEPDKRLVQVLGGQLMAQNLKPRRQRVAAGLARQYERVGLQADLLRAHDLVGARIFQDALLMDARRVRERVLADDRLVGLHRDAGDRRQQPRGGGDLLCLHIRVDAKLVCALAQDHGDLFQSGVAGALADSVDRNFDLAGAVHDRRQRVRDREAQIVMAMDREDRLPDVLHALSQLRDAQAPFLRHGVADGVGDVDRSRAGRDDRLDHLA